MKRRERAEVYRNASSDVGGSPRTITAAAFTTSASAPAKRRASPAGAARQLHSVWRLRASSSSRRECAPGFHDTSSLALRDGEMAGLVARTTFPNSVPANNNTPRQKAECVISVCMSITLDCPCAATASILASFYATRMFTRSNRQSPPAAHREQKRRLARWRYPATAPSATPLAVHGATVAGMATQRIGAVRPRRGAG